MSDYLLRALARDKRVLVFACNTKNLVETARIKHDLWPITTAALGRTMSASLMLAAKQKDENDITVKIDGGGLIGNIVVSCNSEGIVRGFVKNPHVDLPSKNGKLAVGEAVGTVGNLTVIKNDFTGSTPIVSGEIAEDFTAYYSLSEQIPSVVSLGVLVDVDGSVICSGGFVIELLPDHTEEDIIYIENKLKDFPAISSLFQSGKTVEDIINLLFNDANIIGKHELTFSCNCSEQRVINALKMLNQKDIKEMISDKKPVVLHCDFCSGNYEISIEQLKTILSELQLKESFNS